MTTLVGRLVGTGNITNTVPVNGQQIDNGCTAENEQITEPAPMPMDVTISNVVCSFSTKCHLNLKRIAMEGSNVEYHRQHGMLNMRIRKPKSTASIWSSGKITCTGAVSEEAAKIAARRFARVLQKLGYKVKFSNFRVVNVLGTCGFPFSINIVDFSRARKEASYEPEIHPGVTYKITEPKATLKIFSTGSITVTAPRVANVLAAVDYIFPLVEKFQAGPPRISSNHSLKSAKRPQTEQSNIHVHHLQNSYDDDDDDSLDSEDDEDEFDSDDSQD